MKNEAGLGELRIEFTEEMILAYGGSGRHLHADRVVAAELGFPGLVSWGTLTILPFTALLARFAGPDWSTGGVLSTRLSKPVCAGDVVVYSGREIEESSSEDNVRTFELTAVSARSVLVATAQATLGRAHF